MNEEMLLRFGDIADVQWLAIDVEEDFCSEVVVVKGASAIKILSNFDVVVDDGVVRFAMYLDRTDSRLLSSNYLPSTSMFRQGMYWIGGRSLPIHVTVDFSKMLASRVNTKTPSALLGKLA